MDDRKPWHAINAELIKQLADIPMRVQIQNLEQRTALNPQTEEENVEMFFTIAFFNKVKPILEQVIEEVRRVLYESRPSYGDYRFEPMKTILGTCNRVPGTEEWCAQVRCRAIAIRKPFHG